MDTNQMQFEEERSPLGTGKTLYPRDTRQPDHVPDAIDRYPLIIQNFLGTPVRFFKVDFEINLEVEILSGRKFLQAWVIPLADIALAVNYPPSLIRRMIQLNLKFFVDFYKVDFVTDNHGRHQSIIFIPIEMLSAFIMEMQASRTKNPKTRERARHFQRWAMIVLHMIRTRKLMPVRWIRSVDINSKYIPLLFVPSGREHQKRVVQLAKEENKSIQTIYRHLVFLRGSNIITSKGIPKRSRSAA